MKLLTHGTLPMNAEKVHVRSPGWRHKANDLDFRALWKVDSPDLFQTFSLCQVGIINHNASSNVLIHFLPNTSIFEMDSWVGCYFANLIAQFL